MKETIKNTTYITVKLSAMDWVKLLRDLDNAVENAKELLSRHDTELGQTTLKNRRYAQLLGEDISNTIESQVKIKERTGL